MTANSDSCAVTWRCARDLRIGKPVLRRPPQKPRISLLGQALAEAGEYQRAQTVFQDGIPLDLGVRGHDDGCVKTCGDRSLAQLRGNDFPNARNHALEAVRLVRTVELYRRAARSLRVRAFRPTRKTCWTIWSSMAWPSCGNGEASDQR